MKVVVIIPVYGDANQISLGAKNSIKQYFKILHRYKIVFIAAAGFDDKTFCNHFSELSNTNWEFFDKEYFDSAFTYNRLLICKFFYKRFVKYDYILIAQTDAWVFKDELEHWCEKGYDYIGAPWFEGFVPPTKEKNIIGVGNGGFSLRKIQSSIKLLKKINRVKFFRKIWHNLRLNYIMSFMTLLKLFKPVLFIKDTHALQQVLKNGSINEDYYWTQFLAKAFSGYRVATVEDAIKFSFEVNPSLLYDMNHKKLPFGCHAWEKYEPEFWKNFIPETLTSIA